jgi:outer membrane protein with beta-barrel domain
LYQQEGFCSDFSSNPRSQTIKSQIGRSRNTKGGKEMKRMVSWSLGIVAMVCIAGPAFSQTFGFKVNGLYAFEFSGDLKPGELKPEDAFGGGGGIFFAVTPYLKLDLGLDYLKMDIKDAGTSQIELLPLTFSVRGGPNFDCIFLYAGLGIGYSYNSYSGGTGMYYTTLHDCPIYFASLGAEISLTEYLFIQPEVRYNCLSPELEHKEFTPGGWVTVDKKDWELDHLQFRLSLGVGF